MSLPDLSLRRSERIRQRKLVDKDKEEFLTKQTSQAVQPTESKKKTNEKTQETRRESSQSTEAASISKSKTLKSKGSKISSSTRSRRELELETEIKKKELEFRHQQEMMDLQLALELAKVDECSKSSKESTGYELAGTVESFSPNVDKWTRGKSPWEGSKAELLPENKIKDTPSVVNSLFLPQEPIAFYHLNKILTRQSIPQDLPEFSGDPLEWPNFIFSFRHTTTLCGYKPEENLCRLQKALKGHARKIVDCLLILPSNVEKIISILEQRFGRPEQIIRMLLSKIKNFPTFRSDQFDQLIRFSDEVQNVVCTIETLEGDDYLRNPMFLEDLLDKLPTNLKLGWVEHVSSSKTTQKPKLLEFSSWLNKKANFACQIQKPDIDRHKNNPNSKLSKNNTILSTNERQIQGDKKCFCCSGHLHHLSKCSKFLDMTVNQRWEFITSKRACFCCLFFNHNLKTCRKIKKCGINSCEKPHNQLLHTDDTSANTEPSTSTEVTGLNASTNTVLLKILPVVLSNGDKTVNTYALLDDASTVTLMDQDLADRLQLDGPRHSLCIQWTNSQTKVQDDSRVVSCSIGAPHSSKNFQIRRVRTLRGMSLPTQTVDIDKLYMKYPYIDKNLNILSFNNAKPLLLIGQDNWPLIVNRKIITGPWNCPALSKTLLGWTIHGNVDTAVGQRHGNHQVNHVTQGEKDDLDMIHDMIKQQWQLDTSGVDKVTKSLSKEDIRAQQILDRTMHRNETGEKMVTGLLWKDENIVLPESKSATIKRLYCTERKIDKDKQFGQAYCDKIKDMEEKQYIRKLSEVEARTVTPKTWYLPHFGVINPNKPNKIRIVFDAAAKSHGVSLNDCLLTGPDLYNSLVTILLNFRIKKFAFTADIKEMFLQVQVRQEDRCAQRILFRGLDRDREPDTFEINVVFFGSTSGPCLAQEAKNKNAMDFKDIYPEATKAIIEDHYMDDYLGCADSEEDGIQLVQSVIHVHKKGGFEICNWISNSQVILDSIDEKLRATGKDNKIDDKPTVERILGVWWNPKLDSFTFQTKFHKIDKELLENRRYPTKREILKVVMSVFDPLGFVTHIIIQGKILLQDVFRHNLGWDEVISDDLFEKWIVWLGDLRRIFEFQVPRQYFNLFTQEGSIQLHIFTDASDKAYSSVAYLRIETDNDIKVSFVLSKARVAPLKPLSIPRLELQGALMGARLGNHIKENLRLNIVNTFFWTDSKTVLYWIRSEAGRFRIFVAQRLGEIQDLTNTSQWRYVPSKQNPADQATKRNTEIDFTKNSTWLFGPQFLKENFQNWPKEKDDTINNVNKECLEMKGDICLIVNEKLDLPIPDPSRFSNWNRLRCSMAWTLKFCKILRKTCRPGNLEPEDIKEAELILFKQAQNDCFSKEFYQLKNNNAVEKSSRLYTLSPKLDESGIIRLDGRLNNLQEMDKEFVNPIILDPKHQITKLLLKHHHEECFHQGQEVVISKLREKFWIIKVRQAVKNIFRDCLKCKIRRALPDNPLMGQLPLCRLEPTVRCFMKTGVDYFGPIKVVIKRSTEKRYGVIFTCMVTRAIHLEIAHDLSANSFIHTLRQFGCRRGFPTEMYSDNGGNFKLAEKELATELKKLNQSDMQEFCNLKGIKWHWNPPLAPHMGGTWERLIQCVKKVLSGLLETRNLQEYVLRTLFAEAENIVNSRPLTHISVDPTDLEPLTPNHFLIGPNYCALPCTTTDNDLCLLSKWKAAQKLSDFFWKRWLTEYMPFLIKRSKWHKDNNNSLMENDLVLIVDPEGPRNVWPKGKIIKLYPGRDQRIRVVDVKLSNGHILRRPVTKICKLDIRRN